MILSAKHAETLTTGSTESMDMSIDEGDKAVLMQILSEGLYKDPIGSTIREWTSNALDSHTEAGVKEPVVVEVVQDGTMAWWFKVTDFGVGISPDRAQNIISKYAASTKRHTNTMLGAFGLGLKSGLAYSDSFTFTTRYNGKEYVYTMYKAEEGTKIDLMREGTTKEKNGTTFQVQIKNWMDRNEFITKCSQQLCYFESVYFNVDGISNSFQITKDADWKYSELSKSNQMHMSLDNVYYAIDFNRLGIPVIHAPIALNFSIEEGLIPIPSREDIKYTPQAKELILNKLRKVATKFVEGFNAKIQDADRFMDIWNKFNNTKYQILPGITVDVNEFTPYTDVTVKEPTVKGIKTLNLKALAAKLGYIFTNYEVRGKVSSGTFYGKYTDGILDPIYMKNYHYLFADDRPKGVHLEYIKHKMDETTYFLYKLKDRKLGSGRETAMSGGLYNYKILLGLNSRNKPQWREMIKEFLIIEQQLLEGIKHVNDYQPDAEWLEQRKLLRKKAQLTKVEKVEVNPKYGRNSDRWGSDTVFEARGVELLTELRKKKSLQVYGGLDQKDKLGVLFKWIGHKSNVVLLSARDLKKIEEANIHNWISIDNFMKGTNKTFQGYVTALRISDLITKKKLAFEFAEEIIKKLSEPLAKKMKDVKDYAALHSCSASTELKESLLQIAEEKDLWDKSIIDTIEDLEELFDGAWDFTEVLFKDINSVDRYGYSRLAATKEANITALMPLMVDILKYRKFKLNLSHYPKKEDSIVGEPVSQGIEEALEAELETINI